MKLGHEEAHDRWDAVEEKTMKYLTLLGVIVAAAAFGGVDEVARALAQRRNWLDWMFVLASGGVGVFAVGAFVCFVRALRLQTIMEPPLGRDLVSHVATHNYVDVLYSMSVRFVDITEQLDASTAKKARSAVWGYRGLVAVLICAIISTVAYMAIKTGDEMRSKPTPTNQPGSQQTTPSGPSAPPARPSSTSPNPSVSAPAGQTFTKGIEGPRPPTPPRAERR